MQRFLPVRWRGSSSLLIPIPLTAAATDHQQSVSMQFDRSRPACASFKASSDTCARIPHSAPRAIRIARADRAAVVRLVAGRHGDVNGRRGSRVNGPRGVAVNASGIRRLAEHLWQVGLGTHSLDRKACSAVARLAKSPFHVAA